MTVSTTSARQDYAGNGSSISFPVPFPFFAASDIRVVSRVVATGVETVLSLGVNYTVSGGGGATGTVTATVAPATGVTWSILRATPATQSTDYNDYSAFPAASHEAALDRLTLIAQEIQRDQQRMLRATETDGVMLPLPSSMSRAGKFLGWDADGNPVASVVTLADGIVVSPYGATLISASDAAAARTALQVASWASSTSAAFVTPEMFGSVSGDALTAIQAAIDDRYNAGGGVVLLPGGSYAVSNSIQVKQGVILAGLRGDYTTLRPTALGTFPIVRIVGGRAGLRDVQITAEALYVEGTTWPGHTAVRIEAPRARLANVMGAFMSRGIDCRNYGGHYIENPDMRRMKDFYYIIGNGSSGQYVGDCTWIAPLAYTDFPDASVSADANKGVAFYIGSGANAQYIVGLQTAGTLRGLVMDDGASWKAPENIFLSGTTIIDAPYGRALDLTRGKRFSLHGGKISSRNGIGVFVGGDFVGAVDILGTDIARCGLDGAYVQSPVVTAAQVTIEACNIVCNSLLSANTRDGLVIEPNTNITITGNRFVNGWNGLTETQRYGIRVGDGSACVGTISGNYFRANATAGALLGTATPGVANNTGPQAPAPNYPVAIQAVAFASLPAAASYPRAMVAVTDRSGRPAISDGTNWRFADGTIVS